MHIALRDIFREEEMQDLPGIRTGFENLIEQLTLMAEASLTVPIKIWLHGRQYQFNSIAAFAEAIGALLQEFNSRSGMGSSLN